MSKKTPLELLENICAEIYERWDKDMRSGKLLSALSGNLPRYRSDVTAVRAALSGFKSQGEDIQRAWDILDLVDVRQDLHSTEGHLAVLRGIQLGRRLAEKEMSEP